MSSGSEVRLPQLVDPADRYPLWLGTERFNGFPQLLKGIIQVLVYDHIIKVMRVVVVQALRFFRSLHQILVLQEENK